LRPSPHTLLINCAIGFCIDNDTWIHPLHAFGYSPELIEHKVELRRRGGTVKPDVVVNSNRLNHALIFDCKGGISSDEGQISRYRSIEMSDIGRYIRIHNPPEFSHDICILDYAENHAILEAAIANLPFLTLGEGQLTRSRRFTKFELNQAFQDSVPIPEGMVEPVSYYPFSEIDSQGVIVKHVLRAMMTILQDRRRREMDVLAADTYRNPDVMKTIHPMYRIMGREHQESLERRVSEILTHIQKAYSDFTLKVAEIQTKKREGGDATVAISNLTVDVDEIVKREESETGLDFWTRGSSP